LFVFMFILFFIIIKAFDKHPNLKHTNFRYLLKLNLHIIFNLIKWIFQKLTIFNIILTFEIFMNMIEMRIFASWTIEVMTFTTEKFNFFHFMIFALFITFICLNLFLINILSFKIFIFYFIVKFNYWNYLFFRILRISNS
jgi:hypothetical protein